MPNVWKVYNLYIVRDVYKVHNMRIDSTLKNNNNNKDVVPKHHLAPQNSYVKGLGNIHKRNIISNNNNNTKMMKKNAKRMHSSHAF